MIKVLIIDDHQLVIEGIHTLLENETNITWCGSTKTSKNFFQLLQQHQPDVVLMDINLPEINGLELCRQTREKFPAVYVIGLSTSDQPAIIKKMLDNGASGYLLKDASKAEIIAAIQQVAKGKNYVSFSVAEALKNNLPQHEVPVLTKREKEVLELISEGMTNHEIADKLFLTTTTVDSHRKNMLTKFHAKNTAALIKIAMLNKLI